MCNLKLNEMNAKEYIEYIDSESGESWSNSTDEIADVMEDYAKMYHEQQLKLLSTPDAERRSEELPNRCPACGRTDEERLMMTSECGVSACPY